MFLCLFWVSFFLEKLLFKIVSFNFKSYRKPVKLIVLSGEVVSVEICNSEPDLLQVIESFFGLQVEARLDQEFVNQARRLILKFVQVYQGLDIHGLFANSSDSCVVIATEFQLFSHSNLVEHLVHEANFHEEELLGFFLAQESIINLLHKGA